MVRMGAKLPAGRGHCLPHPAHPAPAPAVTAPSPAPLSPSLLGSISHTPWLSNPGARGWNVASFWTPPPGWLPGFLFLLFLLCLLGPPSLFPSFPAWEAESSLPTEGCPPPQYLPGPQVASKWGALDSGTEGWGPGPGGRGAGYHIHPSFSHSLCICPQANGHLTGQQRAPGGCRESPKPPGGGRAGFLEEVTSHGV